MPQQHLASPSMIPSIAPTSSEYPSNPHNRHPIRLSDSIEDHQGPQTPPTASANHLPRAQGTDASVHRSSGSNALPAVSSSAPTSPDYRSASASHDYDSFTFSCPSSSVSVGGQSSTGSVNPMQDTHYASSLVSDSSTMSHVDQANATLQSPLTRLQAKRDRDRDRRSHRSHTSHDSSNHLAPAGSGVKRRWTSSLLADVHAPGLGLTFNPLVVNEHTIHLDGSSNVPAIADNPSLLSNTVINAGSGGDSDMDSSNEAFRLDGSSRPSKRITRR